MASLEWAREGISVYASEAIRELRKAGWNVDIPIEENHLVLRHGRLIRLLPYTDSLASLVDRGMYQAAKDLIRFRTQS